MLQFQLGADLDVLVLRHGEAGNRVSVPAMDTKRPLTQSGRKEIEEVASAMRDRLNLKFDRIASSPLARAFQTAEIVEKAYGGASKLETWDELRPEGSRPELERKLSKLRRDARVLLVGHEPYLSTLMAGIIAGGGPARISLKKGGLAKLRISSFSPRATGELRWLLTPKQLKKL